MAGPVYSPEGVPLPDTSVAEAIASGDARFDRRQTYDMIVKGIRMKVPGDQVWQNIREHGGRLETYDEAEIRRIQSSPAEIAKTFGEQAASTATFGASDVALEGLAGGKEYTQARQRRERALPGVATAGQVTGILPGLFVGSGEASLGGKALQVVGAPGRAVSTAARVGGRGIEAVLGGGRVGRIGALATEGAIEGAAYQAGREVSDAAIRDKEMSAEAVLMGGLEGGAIGGAVGSVLGIGKAATGAAGKAVSEIAAESPGLRRVARSNAFDALHPKAADVKKLGGTSEEILARKQRLGAELLGENGGPNLIREAGIAPTTEQIVPIARRELQKVGKELGDLRKSVDKQIKVWAKGAESTGIEAPVDMRKYTEQFFRKVNDDILTPLQQSKLPAMRRNGQRVSKQLEDLEVSYLNGEHISFEDLNQFRLDLRKTIQPKTPKNGIPSAVPAHFEYLEQAERTLEGVIEGAVDDAASLMGVPKGRYQALKMRYDNLSKITQMGNRSTVHAVTNQSPSPFDVLTGGNAATVAAVLGGGGLGSLAAAGAAALGRKILRERGSAAVAVAADVVSSKLASRAQAAQMKLGETVANGIKPVPMSSKVVSLATKGRLAYENTMKRVHDDAEFEKHAASKVASIQRAAPRTAARVTATLAGDREYLKTLVPPASHAMVVGKDHTPPARSAMAAMNRAAEALENPQGVAEAIKDGSLSPDQAAAIRERRPELLETMRESAFDEMAKLAAAGKAPDHQSRITLSVLFGAPVEPLMEPARLKNLQQVHKARYEEVAMSPPPGPSGGVNKHAQRRETDTERLAGSNS